MAVTTQGVEQREVSPVFDDRVLKHVISSDLLTTEQTNAVFERADYFHDVARDRAAQAQLATRHLGQQVCTLFYEPSTRTRVSFEAAAGGIGIHVISTENAGQFSSAIKGETLQDTVRVLDEYDFGAIIMRHPDKGSAAEAANVATKTAIINAGDGAGEHPTQSLLDAYTIKRDHGRLDQLRVVIGGDLKHGRTARSLAKLLAQHPDNEIVFVSTPELQMGEDVLQVLNDQGVAYTQTDDMKEAFTDANVVYWTRLQKERLEPGTEIPGHGFVIDTEAASWLPGDATIMHPLPRVDEIDVAVDGDPRARYFEQAGNGLYVRKAILDLVLGGEVEEPNAASDEIARLYLAVDGDRKEMEKRLSVERAKELLNRLTDREKGEIHEATIRHGGKPTSRDYAAGARMLGYEYLKGIVEAADRP